MKKETWDDSSLVVWLIFRFSVKVSHFVKSDRQQHYTVKQCWERVSCRSLQLDLAIHGISGCCLILSAVGPISKIFGSVLFVQQHIGWYPRGVMVKTLDCGIVYSEFKLQLLRSLSDKYPWGKAWTYPSSYGLNSTSTVLLEWWFWN